MTRQPRRYAGDTGLGLLELVVGMAIMSVFGAIVTAAFAQMFQLYDRADEAASAQSQLDLAFLRLDGRIRYATGISTPGQTGGDWYVEYLTSNTGTDTCGELRLTTASVLRWREWPHGGTPGGWTTLATGVSSPAPFAFTAAGTTAAYPALRLSVTSSVGGASRQLTVAFPALNAAANADTSADCVEGRTVP